MHPTRPNTPAINSTGQNTPYACISRDSDYCITKYSVFARDVTDKSYRPPCWRSKEPTWRPLMRNSRHETV